jgi:AmiR/NasT family two-component response regulator
LTRAVNQAGVNRCSQGPKTHPIPAPDRYNGEVITVYLLDDHEVVRRGLREMLEHEGDIEVVGESGSAVEAAHRIPALRPDVAVLDGRLPDGSGIASNVPTSVESPD